MKSITHLVICLLACCTAATAAAGPPNILFIMSDDHALEAIGAYDSWLKDYVRTPAIERLAREGMRFDNVAVNNSICSPSRASILTGQYNHKNGVPELNGAISEDSPVFTEELQKSGYQTAVYGKWHLNNMPRGFDDYAITERQGRYFNPKFITPGGRGKARWLLRGHLHG